MHSEIGGALLSRVVPKIDGCPHSSSINRSCEDCKGSQSSQEKEKEMMAGRVKRGVGVSPCLRRKYGGMAEVPQR